MKLTIYFIDKAPLEAIADVDRFTIEHLGSMYRIEPSDRESAFLKMALDMPLGRTFIVMPHASNVLQVGHDRMNEALVEHHRLSVSRKKTK